MTPISTFMNGRPPARGLIWLGLTERGRFLIRGTVHDGGGGYTETYHPAPSANWGTTTNIACRIDAGGGGQGEVAERISDLTTHTITMPPGTAVSIENDFQIEGLGRFEITAVIHHTDEMATQIEVTDRTP